MLGKSKYGVEEKSVRNQPDAVIIEYFPVPTSIFDYYKNVVLSADVLFVIQIPYLASISKNIHYATIKALDSTKIPVMDLCHSYICCPWLSSGVYSGRYPIQSYQGSR